MITENEIEQSPTGRSMSNQISRFLKSYSQPDRLVAFKFLIGEVTLQSSMIALDEQMEAEKLKDRTVTRLCNMWKTAEITAPGNFLGKKVLTVSALSSTEYKVKFLNGVYENRIGIVKPADLRFKRNESVRTDLTRCDALMPNTSVVRCHKRAGHNDQHSCTSRNCRDVHRWDNLQDPLRISDEI